MEIVDIIIIAVIAGILGLAAWYVHKSKKRGRKCIGCPEGGCSNCTCGCGEKTK